MRQEWGKVCITKVSLAIHVLPGTGKAVHKDRPYHGFVINCEGSEREYCFADGTVLRVDDSCLLYLPKGSGYHVKTLKSGGCYAINFDAQIEDAPFAVKLKNPEKLRGRFRQAAEQWYADTPGARICAMGALYDILFQVLQEQSEYTSWQSLDKLQPAIQMLDGSVGDPGVTVAALAKACGVSEVYFRKLFKSRFGVTPKEYIIQKRIGYARQLLRSGQFSVSQVALLCGYTEPCHFSRDFSARVGVSPNQYT